MSFLRITDSNIFNTIMQEFQYFRQVKAIAIGGSTSSKTSDNKSDIDIYIFVENNIPIAERENIVKKYSSKYEVGGEYFGSGDEFYVDNFLNVRFLNFLFNLNHNKTKLRD